MKDVYKRQTWREEMKDCTIRVEVDAQVVRIEQEITPKL